MGAYPALYINPPQDPTVGLQRALTLRNLVQQQPLELQQRQQAVQSGQLQLQLQQQQVKDQQAVTSAWKNYDPQKQQPEDLIKGVLNNGGSGNAANQLQQMMLARQQQLMTLDKDSFDLQQKRTDRMLGRFDAAKGVSDDQLAGHVQGAIQDSLTAGDLKPQEAQAAYQAFQQVQGDPKAMRDALDSFEKSHMLGSQIASRAKEAAETAKTQLETQIMQQYGTPQQQEAKYIALQTQKNLKTPISAQDQAFMKAYEHNKTLVPTATFNLQNAGVAGQGGQPSAVAQMIASGQAKWSDFISPRSPMSVKNTLAAEVKAINPNFNTGDFAVEQAVRKQFTSGSAAQNLTAFNTAIEHANQLNQAVDELGNINERTLNRLGNTIGVELGSDKTTNFNVIKNALSGEISKVFKGGQATDAEIKEVQGPFSASNSPKQLKGAIQNAIRLMNSKREALRSQYQAGMQGQPNFGPPAGAQTASPQGIPAGATGKARGSDGNWYYHDARGGILGQAPPQ